MAKVEANLLSNVEVDEVSLVNKGANKRKYLLLKSEDSSESSNNKTNSDTGDVSKEESLMNEEILKAAAEVELSEEDVKAAVEKAELSEKGAEAAKAVLKVLKAASEDLPKEFYTDLVKLAGGEIPVEIKEVEKIVEVEKKSDAEKAEELKKAALENLPDEQRAVIEKSLEIAKSVEERATKIEEELKKEREQKALAEMVAIVKSDFAALPIEKKEDSFASILFKTKTALSEDEYKELGRVLKAGNEAINRSEDLKKVGSSFSGNTDSYGKLDKLAKQLVDKLKGTDGEITYETAVDKLLQEDPSLYDEGGVN